MGHTPGWFIMTCKNCHHTPSCRFDGVGMKCYCKCHDVADAAPALLEACEAFLARYDNNLVKADLLFADVAEDSRAAIKKARGQ